MVRFTYKAKKGPKETVAGVIEADTRSQALQRLSDMGLYPIIVTQEEVSGVSPAGHEALQFHRISRKVRPSDVAVFTRQLGDLVDAGLTLVNSLDVIYNQTDSRRLKEVVADIRDYVRGGNTFTQALKRHPDIFSNLYIGMIHSGEMGGTLSEVLVRLADFMESQTEFKSKIFIAMAYPSFIASIGIISCIFLLGFVVPKIVTVFEDVGQALPFITLTLLNISRFIQSYWYLLIGIVLCIIYGLFRINKSAAGKGFLDMLRLKIPVIGVLIKDADITRFTYTLGTLLHSGVSILGALEIAKDVVSTSMAKADIHNAYIGVRDGSTLAESLSRGSYFPLFVTNMIAVGEESGQLEKSLLKIAQSYEKHTDKLIRLISSIIEPILILFVALMIGFIVLSILLPILQMSFIAW